MDGENQERLSKIKIEGTPERKMRELALLALRCLQKGYNDE